MAGDTKEIVGALRNLDVVLQKNLKTFEGNGPKTPISKDAKERNECVDVCVRVVFLKVGEVNTVAEKFAADVFVQARWREPALDLSGIPEGEIYNYQDFWNPKLFVENALGELKEDIWYTVSYNEVGEGYIYQKRRVKGNFYEQMELKDYPFDTQDLSITLSTERGELEVRMIADPLDVSSVNVQSFVDEQEWKLHKFVKSSTKVTTNVYQSLKHKHPAVSMSCKVTRRFHFYMWNIILIMIFISSLVFTTFTVGQDKVQNRLQLSFILLLSNITFKFTVSQTLPKVSYLTLMDKYIIGSMFQLCVVCVWHSIVSRLAGDGTDLTTAILADRIALGILGGIYIMFNVVFILVAQIKASRKLKKYARREESHILQMQAIEETSGTTGKHQAKVSPLDSLDKLKD